MSQTKEMEQKWIAKWENAHLFEADPDSKREKKLVTFPYPYMNGPLHVGHTFTASRVDAYARFKRMQGYNVLWPWGWHWTGQPLPRRKPTCSTRRPSIHSCSQGSRWGT